jgi:hypothetical protein
MNGTLGREEGLVTPDSCIECFMLHTPLPTSPSTSLILINTPINVQLHYAAPSATPPIPTRNKWFPSTMHLVRALRTLHPLGPPPLPYLIPSGPGMAS